MYDFWVVKDGANGGNLFLEEVPFPDKNVFSKPYPTRIWDVGNDGNIHLKSVAEPDINVLTKPFPMWIWHVNEASNEGRLFLLPLADLPDPPKPPLPVGQHDYIRIYDKGETDFEHNGKRILNPIYCVVTETLNGTYELELEQPFDPENTYREIFPLDIIKCRGQLFRIFNVQLSSQKSSVIVNAFHVFFDLNNYAIGAEDGATEPITGVCPDVLGELVKRANALMARIAFNEPQPPRLPFQFFSNVTGERTITPKAGDFTSLLIGGNSVLAAWDADILRDNFKVEIAEHLGKKNAFDILYGREMTEITVKTECYSQITMLAAYDNFGNFASMCEYDANSVQAVKTMQFRYDEEDATRFWSDVTGYFRANYDPRFTYTVNFVDLRKMAQYSGFLELQALDIGDEGYIQNERAGIRTVQRIAKKVTDGLTGYVTSVELGTPKDGITKSFFAEIRPMTDPAVKAEENARKSIIDNLLGSHNRLAKFSHNELAKYKHEILGGHYYAQYHA